MNRLAFDAVAALTLGVTALLGAYAPVILVERARARGGVGTRSLTYVLGNMLSAGVMVSAGFCHLLNDALDAMPAVAFPLAPFLAGCGYFMTLIADAIAASTTGVNAHNHCTNAADASRARVGSDDITAPTALRRAKSSDLHVIASTPTALAPGPPGFARSGAMNGGGSDYAAPPRMLPQNTASIEVLAARGALEDNERDRETMLLLAGGSTSEHVDCDPIRAHEAGGSGTRASTARAALDLESASLQPIVTHAPAGTATPRVAFVTAALMGVALCFHSVLEGAALGAQETVASSAHIFIAIVSHKGLAAYALGSSVVDSGVAIGQFWSVIIPFTLASPVGIFIGYIVSDLAQGMGAACISALAAGTFLYVAFMEVIPKELRDGGNTAAKLIALMAGYGVMSLLAIWA